MITTSRGFLRDIDISYLKKRSRVQPFDLLWKRLLARTQQVTRVAQQRNFATKFGQLAWSSYTPMLSAAALIYQMTNAPSMLEYFERALDFIDTQSRQRQQENKKCAVHSHAEIAIAADLLRDCLDTTTQKKLLVFMREIAIDDNAGDAYIVHGGGSNISLAHNVQAAVCALLWGEECGHPSWEQIVQQGINHTRCYLRYGCDEKAYSYEGTGYGHSVFTIIFPLVELLFLTGVENLYDTEPHLRAIVDASQQSLFPDASFAINDNDIGLRSIESMPYLLLLARHFDDAKIRGLWQFYQGPEHPIRPYGDMRPWITRRTGDGILSADSFVPDPFHSLFFTFLYWEPQKPLTPLTKSTLSIADYSPGTETINWRTSWNEDAIYCNIQSAGRSRMSLTHGHADAGHFSIFAHGEYLAIDTGRYNSDEDQHSVMLVDGRSQNPIAPGWGMEFLSGQVAAYENDALLNYARVDAAHMKDCIWANRDFLWVPYGGDDAYLVVIDNLNNNNYRHSYWWQLQAHPEAKIQIASDWQAKISRQHARLDLSFVWPSSLDFPDNPHTFSLRQDVKEWHYPYGEQNNLQQLHEHEGLLNTSYFRPRLIGELDGLNGHLLSVISPRRQESLPLKIRRHMQKRLLWVEVETTLGIDTIITSLDRGFIEIKAWRCLSELVFLRHNTAGECIKFWSLGNAPLET